MQRRLRIAERPAEPPEGVGVAVVARNVADPLLQRREAGLVDVLPVVPEAGAKPVGGPVLARDADHRARQPSAPQEAVDRGNDLPVGEVARDAEDHERVGFAVPHRTETTPASATMRAGRVGA